MAPTVLTLLALLPSAAAPSTVSSHRPAPIDPAWRVETSLLRPLGDDLDDVFLIEKPDSPHAARCLTERTYFERGETITFRRLVRLWPSGRPALEIDNLGRDRHTRRWDRDGRQTGYAHCRGGKWQSGWSLGPGGELLTLTRGTGQMAEYGRTSGDRVQSRYVNGLEVMKRYYRGGRLEKIRLAPGLSDRDGLTVMPGGEELFEAKGHYGRTADGVTGYRPYDFNGEKPPPAPRPYAAARAELLKRFAAAFGDAGPDWEALGIEFIRDDKPWPAGR